MNHRTRRIATVATALAATAASGLVVSAPTHASDGNTYTWTAGIGVPGADHHSWGNALNWTPVGIPTDGDSVVFGDVDSGSTQVDGVPDVTLEDLTIASTDHTNATLGGNSGEHLSVAGALTWTGGRAALGLTLPAGATGTIGTGYGKNLWGDLDVEGSLELVDTGLKISWTHVIDVAEGGSFVTRGAAEITNDRCCGDASNRLVNHGTLEVADGTFTATDMQLEQRGLLQVADGSSVVASSGTAKLGPGATYAGGGTLSFDHTAGPQPDEEHPDAYQGAVLLTGSNTFQDGFVLDAGPRSTLSGQAEVTGDGALTLEGATVYGELETGSGIEVSIGGPDASAIAPWDDDRPGYRGHLSAAGPVDVAADSRLDLDHSAVLELLSGGHLRLPGGATIGANTCCSGTATLLGRPGSKVDLGGGDGTAVLLWQTTKLAGRTTVAGRVEVESGGSLTQVGGRTLLEPDSVLKLSGSEFALKGGSFAGTGTLRGTLVATGGKVSPGQGSHPSALSVGGYRQAKRATLDLDVDGLSADRLLVSGTAQLGGKLAAGGHPAPRGRHVAVVKAKHRTGSFAKVSARHWRVAYPKKGAALVSR